jgi:hypothetical protein
MFIVGRRALPKLWNPQKRQNCTARSCDNSLSILEGFEHWEGRGRGAPENETLRGFRQIWRPFGVTTIKMKSKY